MIFILENDIYGFEKNYRRNLINSISGFKSLNLIGTKNEKGSENLALFSQVIHIGAMPPLIGVLFRPNAMNSKRHTLNNIEKTGYYTLNHVNSKIYQQAHQTSAKYPEGISEFECCNLTPEYILDFYAPFVKESHIKIGLEFVEKYIININQTELVIGKIKHIIITNENAIEEDGQVKLELSDSLTVCGLNSYYTAELIEKMPYAKV